MGHIGRDPEHRPTSTGKDRAVYSVAVKTGKEQTTWFNCQSWDKQAGLALQYIKKGAAIYIEGQMTNFQNTEGKLFWVVNVARFQLLGQRAESADQGADYSTNQAAEDGFAYSDDDLPF